MKIIIDTREQLELEFKHPYVTEIIHHKLNIGDYAVEFSDGFVPPIRFERKSIGDLFGTMSKGYSRFKKELVRAQKNDVFVIIIVECVLNTILKGIKHSARDGGSVVKQLFTLMIRHHVPFVCCKNRKEMSEYITRFFIAVGEQRIREEKDDKKNTINNGTDRAIS